jgi:hypothetical protein
MRISIYFDRERLLMRFICTRSARQSPLWTPRNTDMVLTDQSKVGDMTLRVEALLSFKPMLVFPKRAVRVLYQRLRRRIVLLSFSALVRSCPGCGIKLDSISSIFGPHSLRRQRRSDALFRDGLEHTRNRKMRLVCRWHSQGRQECNWSHALQRGLAP